MANVKKVYRCYRQGLAFKERDGSFYGDYERLTVVGADESVCDSMMTAHRNKYVLSSDTLTIVESVQSSTGEPIGIKQDSFIVDEIWF